MTDKENHTLPCFACGQPLEPSVPSQVKRNQPYGGTTFRAYGQYGSTVFDPFHGSREFLELNICDRCLVTNADRILHIMHGVAPPPVLKYETWVPPEVD